MNDDPQDAGINVALDLDDLQQMASLRAIARNNPAYLWQALLWHLLKENALRWQQVADGVEPPPGVTISAWIAEYLYKSAAAILNLSNGFCYTLATAHPRSAREDISADAAMKMVVAALGFTRPGWNAFSAVQSDRQKMIEFQAYRAARDEGLASKDAVARVMADFQIATEAQARKRIREGRTLDRLEQAAPVL